MIDVSKILYEICEDECVFDLDFNLIESGVLDSFAFIELFSKLEELGIKIEPPRISKQQIATPRLIQKLVNEHKK